MSLSAPQSRLCILLELCWPPDYSRCLSPLRRLLSLAWSGRQRRCWLSSRNSAPSVSVVRHALVPPCCSNSSELGRAGRVKSNGKIPAAARAAAQLLQQGGVHTGPNLLAAVRAKSRAPAACGLAGGPPSTRTNGCDGKTRPEESGFMESIDSPALAALALTPLQSRRSKPATSSVQLPARSGRRSSTGPSSRQLPATRGQHRRPRACAWDHL